MTKLEKYRRNCLLLETETNRHLRKTAAGLYRYQRVIDDAENCKSKADFHRFAKNLLFSAYEMMSLGIDPDSYMSTQYGNPSKDPTIVGKFRRQLGLHRGKHVLIDMDPVRPSQVFDLNRMVLVTLANASTVLKSWQVLTSD